MELEREYSRDCPLRMKRWVGGYLFLLGQKIRVG
jgi:hypothetical protein